MTIVDFFKKLSSVLEDFRIKKLTRAKATELLIELETNGRNEGIQHKIDIENLLDETIAGNFDEENSYEDYMYPDSSYEDEDEEEDGKASSSY